MTRLFIGLLSGTSADGIDAALIDFSNSTPKLVMTHYTSFSPSTRDAIFDLCKPGDNEISRLADLDVQLGHLFATAANTLLDKAGVAPSDIIAIGSHGQTIRHYPERQFTLQIGDPNIIAGLTGITTVADFRRKDLALGGQGAPLVPKFHQAIFPNDKNLAIINIGGIANVTFLSPNHKNMVGFDTGPGNTLLNACTSHYFHQCYDDQGRRARSGIIHEDLLALLLKDPFFKKSPPKSTGPEYFNLKWLNPFLSHFSGKIAPESLLATLTELTAKSIVNAIKNYFSTATVLVCGGGVHNVFLMERLQVLAPSLTIDSTAALGIDPDWIEATAFAWLAKQTLEKKPGNSIDVTGAKQAAILGGIYYP